MEKPKEDSDRSKGRKPPQRRPLTPAELRELLHAQDSAEQAPDTRRIKKKALKFYSAADLYGGI